MLKKYLPFIGHSVFNPQIIHEISTLAIADNLELIVLYTDAKYEDMDDRIRLYILVNERMHITEIVIQ